MLKKLLTVLPTLYAAACFAAVDANCYVRRSLGSATPLRPSFI